MGYLFLDTRARDEARAWWVTEAGEEVWQSAGRAQGLLSVIAHERSRLAEDLQGVAIVAGPGRFSALRVGILYAHLIARWYKKPLYSLELGMIETESARQLAYHDIQTGVLPETGYVAPVYDREPNITTPRI